MELIPATPGIQSSISIKLAHTADAQASSTHHDHRAMLFKFGQDVQKPQGIIGVRVPTPDNSFMLINVDVVKAEVPFLIGLDTLDAVAMIVDTVENEFRAPKAGWSVPIIRKFGHVYLEWRPTDKIMFTRHDLQKVQHNTLHPTNQTLIELIKGAKREDFDEGGKKILQVISASCMTCLFIGPKPFRFRAVIPEEADKLVFCDELSIDLMWIEGDAVLHVVDTAPRLSATTYLDTSGADYGQGVDGIWSALIVC
jgi:hypothetical protein